MLDSEGPVCAVVDPSALPPEELKRLYEREHARAEAAEARIAELEGKLGEAEARAEEWRQESVSARCDLNVLRSVFASNKEKLAAARADLKELHRSRSTENVRRLEKEAARLQGLLNAAGIDSGRHSMTGMRKEMSRLKDVIARQAEELKELKAENERLRSARETHAKARFGRKSEKQKKKKSEVRQWPQTWSAGGHARARADTALGYGPQIRGSRPAGGGACLSLLRPSLREERQP